MLSALTVGFVAVAIGGFTGRAQLGAAIGIGIVSHLVLDLLTHNGDIALAPFAAAPKYGTYLYADLPLLAFVLELAYGVMCWRVFRGSRTLLAIIVGFNLANLSLFSRAIPGPEHALAGRPAVLVTVIAAQVAVTLWAVWWAGHNHARRALLR